MTTKNYSERDAVTDLTETLVELDHLIANCGRSDNKDWPHSCLKWFEADTYEVDGTRSGTEGVLEGEPLVPVGLTIQIVGNGKAYIRVLFKPEHPGEFEYTYLGASLDQVDDAFPALYRQIEAFLLRDPQFQGVGHLSAFVGEKLNGKPRMVDLALEALRNGRLARLEMVAEEKVNAQEEFYADEQKDFGIF